MQNLGWDTPIVISVSTNMTMFKAAKLPFKNILKVAATSGVMYSVSTFKDEKRDAAHWNNGAQVLVIDFDEGLTDFAKSWLNEQFGFLVPTRNYMKEKHGLVCERYRALLLLETPLNVSEKEFVNIHKNILRENNLPADASCTDVSRLYYSFGTPDTMKHIKILSGKPLNWSKYNYEDTMQMIGLPSPRKVVDISKYETKVDLRGIQELNKSKRYECPICALEGLDPHKHHLGFSQEKELITCFYDKEGHSPILRALYRKQVLGLDPEIDEECQEIVMEEVKQPDGKVKKKRVVKPKLEDCPDCNGIGMLQDAEGLQVSCVTCGGTGKVPKKPKPKIKKPSLPDDAIPLVDRRPKGSCHFNELGKTLDFDAEIAKYQDEKILGFDVETFYAKEVAISEEQAKEMFKATHISIAATYKRVVKKLKDMALDEIDNTVRLLILGSEKHQTAFDLTICSPEQKQRLFALMKNKLMIGHNLKFDLKSLGSEYGLDIIPNQVYDTMLGSKMLWMMHETFEPSENNSYKNVVLRYCGVNLPKDQGSSDWGQSELTMEQLIYAVNDVRYLIPVFKAQLQGFLLDMKTYKADKVNFNLVKHVLGDLFKIHPVMALEMRFVLALVRIELHGVMVNESTIRDIVKKHQDEIKEAEEKLGFNPASNPSCLAFVQRIIGPQMTSASKEALAEHYNIPEIETLGRAKQAKARAGLLVKMYEKKADGRIHTKFTQILATARLASREPNMQQIPRTVKDYIYSAPPGRCVFSADYPAIELRLGAAYHEEPAMIEAFRNGEDLHYKMANIMTGKPIPKTEEEKKDPNFITKEERTAAKNCNFGYCYGASEYSYQKVQMVKNHIKVSDEDAAAARKSFMELYKVLALHINQTKNRFQKGTPRRVVMQNSLGENYTQTLPYLEEITTLFGRRIAVESANTALNYGVQGSGGDACKLAVCLFEDICEKEGIDAFLVNLIHDDIVAESSIEHKEKAMNALARAMNDAANCLMGCYFDTDVTDEVAIFAETPAIP